MKDLLTSRLGEREKEGGFTLVSAVVVIMIMILGILAAVAVLVVMERRRGNLEGEGSRQSQESVPSAAPADPVSIPWGGIIITIVVLAIIAAFVGIGFFAYNQYQRIQEKQNYKDDLVGRLSSVKEVHDKIINKWAEYELDLEMSIRYPLITDTSHPATEDFYQALRRTSLARPQKNVNGPSVDEYEEAVSTLEGRFDALIGQAKKQAWAKFSKSECSRLETALSLLSMARNEGSSPHERQVAYKRVMSELDGLLTLPEAPVAALEASVLQQIAA